MVRVFGVANHSPEAVIRALIKFKRAGTPDIGILPVQNILSIKKPVKHTFLLFLTVADLMRNLEVLNSPKYEGCSAIVFANPMKLHELVGLQPLDFAPNPEFKGFGFTLRTLDMNKIRTFKGSETIERRSGKYLAKLVEHVQQGSLLNPFMTFIYTLPSVMQGPTKTAVLRWLFTGKSDTYLTKALDGIEQGTVTARVRTKLKDILLTEVGRSFQVAFKAYRESKKAGSVNITKLAKAHSVSDYEMRYILSVIENVKRSDLYVDSFDKAKNRKRA
jgi:hypothetical protein